MPLELKPRHKSVGGQVSEIISSFNSLIRSEINLAKAEIKDTGSTLTKHIAKVALFSSLSLLSALPFLAFLVIGLGHLLDNNYWASSLIVSLICFGIGSFFAFSAYKQIKNQDLTLPNTRETLNEDIQVIDQNIEKISDFNKRRAA